MKQVWPHRSARQIRREVKEELAYHLERRAQELEARVEALRRFGDVDTARAICVSAGIVGRTIQLDNAATTVIGVLPAGLQYPADDALIWLPRTGRPDDREGRRSDYMRVLALPRPGVTAAQAQAQLDRIAAW